MFGHILAIVLVTAIIFVIPVVVYGLFSRFGLVSNPEGSPAAFLAGLLVSKTGTAITFVMLYSLASGGFAGNWLLYAFLWWVMFALGEIGQAIGPKYPWSEAIAGIISETVYFPLAAWAMHWMLP